MNKSLLTNLAAAAVVVGSLLLPPGAVRDYAFAAGVFAFSGAITNWLAVHMLFEKVPGMYGSGVVVAKFEEFKQAIRTLVMENFFTEENFMKFADVALHQGLSAETIEQKVDLDSLFDGFLQVVGRSKFGSMLMAFGGARALEPLREPFKEEFRRRILAIVDSLDLTKTHPSFDAFRPTVESLVQGKLDELQASEVKAILEKMMREHLGWLVIWGGVCGALIGLGSAAAATLLQ